MRDSTPPWAAAIRHGAADALWRLVRVGGRWRVLTFALTMCLMLALLTAAEVARHHGSTATAGPSAHPLVQDELTARDPHASPDAQKVDDLLTSLEKSARAGKPAGTVLGQHVELHNELYNPLYGDRSGLKRPGYYYQRVDQLTGRLPGFVETDLGPGYGGKGWGVGSPQVADEGGWPSCQPLWQYTDDAVELLQGVWSGLPRAADGSAYTGGTVPNCDGSTTTMPDNGGQPAGIVGMSFHEPYPGSPVKSFDQVFCRNSPQAHDPGWFARVIDYQHDTPEYRALLTDLSYLADHLAYLARYDVPVLLRPYHEMNAPSCATGFWWAGQPPQEYQALWRIMYNYLVNTRGLHNLIFVWAPSAWDGVHGTTPWAYYPGDQYVDVVGVDDYSDTPAAPTPAVRTTASRTTASRTTAAAAGGRTPADGAPAAAWTQEWYDGLAPLGKPRIMAESFHVPVNSYQPDTLTRTPWVLWSLWGQAATQHNLTAPTGQNTVADLRLSYDSPLALTGGSAAYGATYDWAALHTK